MVVIFFADAILVEADILEELGDEAAGAGSAVASRSIEGFDLGGHASEEGEALTASFRGEVEGVLFSELR